MKKSKQFMNADDVQGVLGCSHSHALNLIRKMNLELQNQGFLTIAGKVPTAYFAKKWYGFEE